MLGEDIGHQPRLCILLSLVAPIDGMRKNECSLLILISSFRTPCLLTLSDCVFKCVLFSFSLKRLLVEGSAAKWKISVFVPEPHLTLFLLLLLKIFIFAKVIMDTSFTTKIAQRVFGFGLRLPLSNLTCVCSFHIWFNYY